MCFIDDCNHVLLSFDPRNRQFGDAEALDVSFGSGVSCMNLKPDANTNLGSRAKERQKQVDQGKHTRAPTQTSEAKGVVRYS